MRRLIRILIGLAIIDAILFAAYMRFIRPWHVKWGTFEDEIDRPMPGDDAVKEPTYITNRAITIDASPSEVWPWLVQMGEGRAGFYSYDMIDNLLGLDVESSDAILPEYQHLEAGDVIPAGPEGMPVREAEYQRHIVLTSPENQDWRAPGRWSFTP